MASFRLSGSRPWIFERIRSDIGETAAQDIKDISKAIALASTLFIDRSRAFSARGKHQKAADDAALAVKADPSNPGAYLRVAETHFELKKYGTSALAYSRAHILATTKDQASTAAAGYLKALERRGQKWLADNNLSQAIAVYTTCIDFAEAVGKTRWLSNLSAKRGQCLMRLASKSAAKKALEEFNRAIFTASRGDDHLHTYHNGKAEAYLKLGRFEKAFDSAQTAYNLNPALASAYRTAALALEARAHQADAIAANMHNKAVLERVPSEVWKRIFGLCSLDDTQSLSQTNSRWQHLRHRRIRLVTSAEDLPEDDSEEPPDDQSNGRMDADSDSASAFSDASPDFDGNCSSFIPDAQVESDYTRTWKYGKCCDPNEVRSITVYCSRYGGRTHIPSWTVVLRHFPNVEELIVRVQSNMADALAIVKAIRSPGKRWPRLSKVKILWTDKGGRLKATVHDRLAPHGEVLVSSPDLERSALEILAACAQHFSIASRETQDQLFVFENQDKPSGTDAVIFSSAGMKVVQRGLKLWDRRKG